jgi:outer membrane immunogenic protein
MYSKTPVNRPYAPPPFTWQGFYIGINGGYGWSNATITGPGGSSTVNPNGGLLGTTVGYNFQAGSNFVAGIEGDLDYSWMRDTNGAVAPCPACEIRNNYIATARGRLGYAWDRWLPYVTGGAAFGDIQTKTPAGGSQATNKVGWAVGGGLEYAFASPWSAKIEYIYTDLGSANCDAAHCGASTDVSFHASTVRVGINYHY